MHSSIVCLEKKGVRCRTVRKQSHTKEQKMPFDRKQNFEIRKEMGFEKNNGRNVSEILHWTRKNFYDVIHACLSVCDAIVVTDINACLPSVQINEK